MKDFAKVFYGTSSPDVWQYRGRYYFVVSTGQRVLVQTRKSRFCGKMKIKVLPKLDASSLIGGMERIPCKRDRENWPVKLRGCQDLTKVLCTRRSAIAQSGIARFINFSKNVRKST